MSIKGMPKVNFTTNYTSCESRTYTEIENALAGSTKDMIAWIPQGLYIYIYIYIITYTTGTI